MTLKVLVCGGATAGHIEPALNVAHDLHSQGASVEFVGTRRGLDQQLIEGANFPLHLIMPAPLPRTLNVSTITFPLRLIIAILQSIRICRKYRPNVILGFGSFVALPVYVASRILKIPLVVHEANAKPGIANRIGAQFARRKFQAVDDSLSGADTVGIPLRDVYSDFDSKLLRLAALQNFGLHPSRQTILVFGGSQGARHINDVVNSISEELVLSNRQILHIVGSKNLEQITNRDNHHYFEYVEDMSLAYAIADLAICRSGALTVAEISASNTPAIFIPFPSGNGEQERNAESRVLLGAARLLLDRNLRPETLIREVHYALDNLEAMKRAGESHKPVNATRTIATVTLQVAKL